MIYLKYIIFIFFVSSCVYKNQKIQDDVIHFIIDEIKINPSNWEKIATDKSKSQLNSFFLKEENIILVQDFFTHIKISKFDVVNIKNEFVGKNNQKLTKVTLGRKENEFRITFIFLYFEDIDKWKLINLESKSTILEKFQN